MTLLVLTNGAFSDQTETALNKFVGKLVSASRIKIYEKSMLPA